MTITVAFLAVLGAIVAGGEAHRRWDGRRHLRVHDESGTLLAAGSLARVESRKALTHPTWLITLGLLTALSATLIGLESGSSIPSDSPASWFALIAVPVAGLALVVALHRIGTRSRRHRTEEIEAATPTAPRARTLALLAACLAPVPVLVAAAALGLAVSQLAFGLTPNPTASSIVPFLGIVLTGVGGAVVGVLLSRWLPFAVAPLLGIVAIIWLNNGVDHLHPRFRWLRPAVEADYGGRFDVRPLGWSFAFTVGLIVLGGCLALWRHGARPRLVGATAAATAVIVATGWTMTRTPSTDEVAERVDMLEHPTDHQHCETRDATSYCVYHGAESWIDIWHAAVRGVMARVPAAVRPASIEVVQRPTVGTSPYLAQVVAALDPAAAWPADGRLHPALSVEDERSPDLAVAWQAAALAVGLPPATSWERPAGCLAGGQARIVLAHLLAARSTPTAARGLALKATDVREARRAGQAVSVDLEYDYGLLPGPPDGAPQRPEERLGADGRTDREHIAVAGASGWGSDVLAAAALMDLDGSGLDRVVAANWDELVDPATPTARLFELTGAEVPDEVHTSPARTELTDPVACP
jgi:hypothetical protein